MYDEWVDSNRDWIDLEHRYLIDDVILDPNRGPPIQPLREAKLRSPSPQIILTQLDEYEAPLYSQASEPVEMSEMQTNVKSEVSGTGKDALGMP
eukprot:1277754-Rhodomonas_salina.1